MKKLICGLAILGVVAGLGASSTAIAKDRDPIEYRRTLFVPFGQDMLMFEAPKGMCFLDQSQFIEGAIFSAEQKMTREIGLHTLQTYFADCLFIAGFMRKPETDETERFGIINWVNPYSGEKVKMSRKDYLDLRQADYAEFNKEELRRSLKNSEKRRKDLKARGYPVKDEKDITKFEDFTFDAKPLRLKNGVSFGYLIKERSNEEKTIGIDAVTLIRKIPVSFSFQFTGEKVSDKDMPDLVKLMDKFIEQQIELNE